MFCDLGLLELKNKNTEQKNDHLLNNKFKEQIKGHPFKIFFFKLILLSMLTLILQKKKKKLPDALDLKVRHYFFRTFI